MNFRVYPPAVFAVVFALSSCGNVPHDNPMDPNYGYRIQSCTAAPTISSLNPSSSSGGYTVTITGTNLSGISSVSFGDVQGTITSRTDTQAVVIAPSHQAGVVSVTVSNACGSATLPNSYTY